MSELFLISKNNLPRNKKKLYWSNHLHSLLINFPPYLPNYLFACLSIFIVHNNFFIINYDDYYSLLWLFEDNFKKFNQSKYRIKLLNLFCNCMCKWASMNNDVHSSDLYNFNRKVNACNFLFLALRIQRRKVPLEFVESLESKS